MSGPPKFVEKAKQSLTSDVSDLGKTTALVTGSVAVGAVLTGSLFRRIRRRTLNDPSEVEPALDADVRVLEIMEGRTRFYEREGSGTPIVLLHSINAAASSFEMKPIFDHFAARTHRPIYALDWFGFGKSERPPVRYDPSIYQRQLRRFLSEHVHQPADLVALSLSCEYAAEIARTLPYLVRRLALIAPTGLGEKGSASTLQRAAISLASSVGAFEILYHRLTKEDVLRRFYDRQVFRNGHVPEELVAYAVRTTNVHGAHFAPRYFVQGSLSTGPAAERAYETLRVPTLVLVPDNADGLVQRFSGLDRLVARNQEHLSVSRLQGGLLPHWEEPDAFLEALGRFLN